MEIKCSPVRLSWVFGETLSFGSNPFANGVFDGFPVRLVRTLYAVYWVRLEHREWEACTWREQIGNLHKGLTRFESERGKFWGTVEG